MKSEQPVVLKPFPYKNFFLPIIIICNAFLFGGYFYYVTPFEKIINPHRYYIKQFVDSLPSDVQTKMKRDAELLGMDIYEYNMKMCGEDLSYFEWLRI